MRIDTSRIIERAVRGFGTEARDGSRIRSRIHFGATFAIACMVVLAGRSLPAQTSLQSGITQPIHSRSSLPDSNYAGDLRSLRFERTMVGLGGEIVGFLGGGFAGYALAGKCGRYNCEWHGFAEFAIGSVIGGVVGTAAMAATSKGYNNCTHGHRFKRALAGATIGGILGVAVLTTGNIAAIPVATLTAPAAAAFALKNC
ncbi:MAG: hypothetical protein WKF55_15875 [Gemmatimonadaceae bacterium]